MRRHVARRPARLEGGARVGLGLTLKPLNFFLKGADVGGRRGHVVGAGDAGLGPVLGESGASSVAGKSPGRVTKEEKV